MALTKREIEIVSMACEYMSEIEQQAFLNDVFNMRKDAGAQECEEIKITASNPYPYPNSIPYPDCAPIRYLNKSTCEEKEFPEITGASYPYPYHIRKAHDKQDTEFVEYSSKHPTGLRRQKEVEL